MIVLKIRSDYVTNSSSSSFIISRDKISEEKLFELLIKLANETQWAYGCKYKFTKEDFKYDPDNHCIYISNFHVRVATEKKPYDVWNEWDDFSWDGESKIYKNHYIIDNDSCCRYDWDVIEQVLGEYGLDLIYGYCD